MSKGKARRNRKKRHQARQELKFGRSSIPVHRLRAGRTGMVHAKKAPSRQKHTYLAHFTLGSDGRYIKDEEA